MPTEVTVEGMSCEHCEQNVEEALRDVEGVTGVEADNEAGTVTIEGDVDVETAVAAVDEAGYELRP